MNPHLPGLARSTEIDFEVGALRHLATKTFHRRHIPTSYPGMDEAQRDVCKLLESKARRRLERKTQVLTQPTNGHIRTRSSHTDEVVACSIRVASLLGLNVPLAHAIALGHDIGHVPFGHQGENYFSARLKKSFAHEVMGVIVAQKLERHGSGLNLTWETLDGMLRHGGNNASPTMTPEASVVRICDKFAYLFGDFSDLARISYPVPAKLRKQVMWFGKTQRQQRERCFLALCRESIKAGKIAFAACEEAMRFVELKRAMYEVYEHITAQNVSSILGPIWDFLESVRQGDPWLLLALMTDDDVVSLRRETLLDVGHLRRTSVGEMLEWLPKDIDWTKPDLGWIHTAPYVV